MRRAVPIIEITNDSDELGVGSPHGEVGSVDTVDGHDVGTEFFVEASVGALGEEIEVLFGEASYVMTNRMDHEAIRSRCRGICKGRIDERATVRLARSTKMSSYRFSVDR